MIDLVKRIKDLLTRVGRMDSAATSDDMSDITTTSVQAKLRLILNRMAPNAFSANVDGAAKTTIEDMVAALADYFATGGAAMASTVDPGGAARSDLETILEDIGKILAGGGITTWPAAANTTDGASIAAGVRAILNALVGSDDFDGWTNISNGAITDMDQAVQAVCATIGIDAANQFSATIDGGARTTLEAVAAALADYFATGGAAMASTIDPGGAVRSDLETILEDIGKILAGGGITTWPAAANTTDGASMAAAIRALMNSLQGDDDFDGWTNTSGAARTSLDAVLQSMCAVLGIDAANTFSVTADGAARTTLEALGAGLADYFAAGGAAMAATVDPGGAARSDLETILEDLGKILAGGGITTWPAAANSTDGASIASALRGVVNALVGDDDFDGWTNISGGAITNLDAAVQALCTTLGIDAANTFSTSIIGANQTTLESALTAIGSALEALGVVAAAGTGWEADGTGVNLYELLMGGNEAIMTGAAQRSISDMPFVQPIPTCNATPTVDQDSQDVLVLSLMNQRPDSDAILTAEITDADYRILRFREGTDTDWTEVVADAAMTNHATAGYAAAKYTFPVASWQPGDKVQYEINNAEVTIAGQVFTLPTIYLFGAVASDSTVDDVVELLSDEMVQQQVFNTAQTVKNDSITLFAIDALGGAVNDIAVEFLLDLDAAATFTPEWYVTNEDDGHITLVARHLPAVITIGTPAVNARYQYTYGDLPEGARLEFRVAQDNNGAANVDIDAAMTYKSTL